MKSTLLLKIILLFLVLTAHESFSQKKIDSLKQVFQNEKVFPTERFKAINRYYRNYTYAYPDSVLPVIQLHFSLAEINQDKTEKSNAHNERSYVYYIKGDLEKSREELKKSIAILETLDDPVTLAQIYSNLGNLYGTENKYQEAVRYFNRSLTVFREHDHKRSQARMLSSLGIIYNSLNSPDLALSYFKQSIKLENTLAKKETLDMTMIQTAKTFSLLKKYDSSFYYIDKALPVIKENNNRILEGTSYFYLAENHFDLGNLKEAKQNIDKSLAIAHEFENNSTIITNRTLNANIILETNLEAATKEAEEILAMLKEKTTADKKAGVYELLYKCYKKQNKYSKSLAMNELYLIYKDSVQQEKNQLAIIEEAIQNEFDNQLLQTKIENEQKRNKLKLTHLKRTFTIIIISLCILLFALWYLRKLKVNHRKKKDELLAELELLKTAKNEASQASGFQLNRKNIEKAINRSINETDWNVLTILLDDPVISNKNIAEKAFLSVDGIGSSLRRMYDYFEIKDSKYKKISLLMEAAKASNA